MDQESIDGPTTCPFCGAVLGTASSSDCPLCGGHISSADQFHASGAEAVQAHERIVNYYNKMNAIRTIAPYVVSVVFAIVGALLILLAPESRSTAANFAAAALLVLAMGIAGFTRFHAKAPGLDINAEKSARSNMTQAVAADRTKAQRSGRVRKT